MKSPTVQGTPWAPAAFPRLGLTVTRATFVTRGDEQWVWMGRVEPATLERLWSVLGRAGFPAVARHPLPAGSTIRTLVAEAGIARQSLDVVWYTATNLPRYDEAFRILDAIIGRLSEDTNWRIAADQPAMLTDIQRANAQDVPGANR